MKKNSLMTLFTAIIVSLGSMSLLSCGDDDDNASLTEENATKEFYVTIKDDVMTYYYDGKKEERKDFIPVYIGPMYGGSVSVNGVVISSTSDLLGEYVGADKVTRAVLDPSMANYKPTSLKEFFANGEMKMMTSIEGLHYLNTSEAKDMSYMFSRCVALKYIDLSSFNTRKVTNMDGMFSGCSSLERIYVSNAWTTGNLSSNHASPIFKDCYNLVGGKGTTFKGNDQNDFTYAHVDGGESYPGYLSSK